MAVVYPYLRRDWEEWKRQMEENRRKRWRERIRRWLNTKVSDDDDEDVEEEESSEDEESNEEDVNVDEGDEGEKRDEAKNEGTEEEGGSSLEKRLHEKNNEAQDEDEEMSNGDTGDVEDDEDEEEQDFNENKEVKEDEEDWAGEEKFDADQEEESNNTEAEEDEEDQVEMEKEMQHQEDEDVEEEENSEDVESNEEDVNVEGGDKGEKRDEAKNEGTEEEGGSSLEKRLHERNNEAQDEDEEMSNGDTEDVEDDEDEEEQDFIENNEVKEEDWVGEEKFDADEERNNYTESEEDEEKQVETEEEMQHKEEDDKDEEEYQEQPGRYQPEEELAEQANHLRVENIWQNHKTEADVEDEEEEDQVSVPAESASGDDSETSSVDKAGNQCNEKQVEDSAERGHPDKKPWRSEIGLFDASTVKDAGEKSTCDEEATTASLESLNDDDIQHESEDEEEAECSDDEDEDYDECEDEVTMYASDDYPANIFLILSEFRDSLLLTDLTLQTEDGQSVCVHSPVMAAVSSLIWKHLSKSKTESSRTNVRIHIDISSGVRVWSVCFGPEVDRVGLEAVVEFAYSGLISHLNKHNMEQIKAAAHALGVPRVLDLCAKEEEWLAQSAGSKKKEKISAAQQVTISLQSIKQLWMDRVGCDIILETLSRSIRVHRAILAASSDYFRGMFTLDMKESKQPCVSLPFLMASDLEALVESSYSGSLTISWPCVFEITSTALQLQYQPALSLCLTFLQQKINPHTCLDVVSFAEAYEITHLLEIADDFVLRQFQKVAGTLKFKDLPAKQLFKYLNSHSLCVPSELVVFNAVVAWIQANPIERLRLAKELMKAVHFPLMTFMEFKEVQSQNMWADPSLTELYEAIFEDFCSNESAQQNQCRIYLPKESLVLTGGDQISEDLGHRSISRDIWFGNSLRNHTGIKKAMEWRRLGEMPEPARFSHDVAVLNGQLYVFGGKKYYGIGDTLSSVYRYDPLQNSWDILPEMLEKRCSFSVVVLDGKVYAIGGHCDPDHIDTVECYCPTTNTWSFTCPLDLSLSGHAARVLQGQIFVSGGQNSDYLCLASMILYHPDKGSTYLANMTRPRANHCMETLAEYLYVAGGITTHDNLSVTDQLACEVYNPTFDFWSAFAPLPVPHVGAGSAVLEGKFYVLGGYSQEDYSDTKMVHRYDAALQKWENMGKMPGPNNELKASVLCLPQHFRL